MNWEKAKTRKRVFAVSDETKMLQGDPASRWLAAVDARLNKMHKHARSLEQRGIVRVIKQSS
jgi:hypothetical protein